MNRRQLLYSSAALAGGSLGLAQEAPRRIKIGQLGVKHGHAAGKLATIRKFPSLFELVGVVEPDEEARRAAEKTPEFQGVSFLTEEELFATPDLKALAVETDVPDLVPSATRAVDAGLHVLLDKPAGDSLLAFAKLLSLAKAKNVVVQMGYMLRYNPGVRFCRRAVREGWLGQVFEIHAVMSKTQPDADRPDLARFKGGAMFELGCHVIDTIVHLLGKPNAVSSFPLALRDDGLADNCLAVLEYPKTTATVRVCLQEVEGSRRRQLVVCGAEGTISILPLEPPKLELTLAKPAGEFRAGARVVDLPKMTGRYDDELHDFASLVRGEKAPDFTAEHDLAVHETILRAGGMM